MIGCSYSDEGGSVSFVGYEPPPASESSPSALDALIAGIVISPSPTEGVPAEDLEFVRSETHTSESPKRVDPVAGVDPPILRTRVEPVFPEEARSSRESGTSILEGIITAEGCVDRLVILQPTREPLLDAAAIRAVRQWEYEPAIRDGKPVSVFLTITVNFRLH